MEKHKPYIRWESRYNYAFGILVLGPWALPVWIPLSIYVALTIVLFFGGCMVGAIFSYPEPTPLIPAAILLGIGVVVGGGIGLYKFFSAVRKSIRDVNGKGDY